MFYMHYYGKRLALRCLQALALLTFSSLNAIRLPCFGGFNTSSDIHGKSVVRMCLPRVSLKATILLGT